MHFTEKFYFAVYRLISFYVRKHNGNISCLYLSFFIIDQTPKIKHSRATHTFREESWKRARKTFFVYPLEPQLSVFYAPSIIHAARNFPNSFTHASHSKDIYLFVPRTQGKVHTMEFVNWRTWPQKYLANCHHQQKSILGRYFHSLLRKISSIFSKVLFVISGSNTFLRQFDSKLLDLEGKGDLDFSLVGVSTPAGLGGNRELAPENWGLHTPWVCQVDQFSPIAGGWLWQWNVPSFESQKIINRVIH